MNLYMIIALRNSVTYQWINLFRHGTLRGILASEHFGAQVTFHSLNATE